MKALPFFIAASALLALAVAGQEAVSKFGPELDGLPLPNIYSGGSTYRVDPYIAAAIQLQALGKEEALRQLGQYALRQGPREEAEPIYVLCRMLFVAHPGITFRGPMLGASRADAKRDPLVPIHIVDGVPFLTFQSSYTLGGAPESPESYLLFCLTQCDWSPYRYSPKSKAEKEAALARLLTEHKELEVKAALVRNQIE